MRLARKRSQSGWTVRSFLAMMYQLGFDFQAVLPAFASNRSGAARIESRNQLLFLLGRVPCEAIHAFRKQPDTSRLRCARERLSSGSYILSHDRSGKPNSWITRKRERTESLLVCSVWRSRFGQRPSQRHARTRIRDIVNLSLHSTVI